MAALCHAECVKASRAVISAMRNALRVIDANANRAREAARLLEDVARFILDDQPLCSRIKTVRHGLTECLLEVTGSKASLVAQRDTPGDVGTSVTLDTESSRSSVHQLAEAAGSRLTEALRAIEECLKLETPHAAAEIERLRYEAYEIERLLLPRLSRPDPYMRVCVLITESLCTHHPWQDVARLAIEAGADGIQLREKELGDKDLLSRARQLVELAQGTSTRIIINDRPDIASLSDAHGVHLGQDDLDIADARAIVGERVLIGVTTPTVDQANRAFDEGADMVGVGPVFSSTTKPKPGLGGIDLIREFVSHDRLRDLPYLAISGIDTENVHELAEIGCRGIAVSSAVCGAEHPGDVVKSLRQSLGAKEAAGIDRDE
ncbi:MAG: thiamine phosphate synthase [Phycisphaerales bacterium]